MDDADFPGGGAGARRLAAVGFGGVELAPVPRDAHGRFAPGNPGRPLGARNRLSGRIARSILKDFEASQDQVLAKLKRWYVPQYVALLARLLPRAAEGADGPDLDALDDAEKARVLDAARTMIARIDAGEATLAELEAALLGEGN
ncbi:MAG TPA: hypothetical protein VGI95_11325 [Caulobacteraceae bacterium]|jgi:hypothetical protein